MQGGNKKMDQFIQYTPTEVVFGKETENQAGAEVKKWGGTKVLVVYGGGSAKRSGLLDRVEASLAKEGLAFEELGGVKPNPRLALAEEGVKKAVEMQADFILAVGGGSSIDTAKAVAHGAANPSEALWDIWTKKVPLTKSLPVGAVLTIPAAGSEMSDSAVLTNEAIGKKAGINTPFNRCKFAIMNPELAATLPKYQIACGVTDIMMHTMERYFIPESQCEMTDEIAEGLLRTVIKNGPKVLENPSDYNAMAEIMWCGSLSHNGLTECGRGITEGSDHKRATEGIERTVAFFHSLGMPTSLHELDIPNPSDEDLRALSMDATQQDTVKLSRIRKLGAQEVYEIYQMAR